MYLMSGNHDIPEEKYTEQYKIEFGQSDFYSFHEHNWKFIVMNSQPFKNVENYEPHLLWLETELQTNASSNLIVFMHIPPFVNTPDEIDRWDNLPRSTRFKILDLFQKHKVNYVFTGHCHRQVSQTALDYNGVKILPVQACSINLDVNISETGEFVSCHENKDDLGWLQVFI